MTKKTKITLQIWILALTSSILLSIPYLVPHFGLVSLFALIPLFAAEQIAHDNGRKFFFHIAYCSFLVWNLITTYWVWFATPSGSVVAFVLNTFQMAILFTLFRWMRKLTKGFLPYVFFIIIWLAWEHSYHNWQMTWPWLLLGNSFATTVKYIQWYEYTGVLGGSLWILLTNMLLYRIILLKTRELPIKVSVITLSVIVLIPMITSHYIYDTYWEKQDPVQVSVLQPNIDPYTDKFNGLTQMQQGDILLGLASEAVKTIPPHVEEIVIAPETFIFTENWRTRLLEERPTLNPCYNTISHWLQEENVDKNINMIVGAVTYKMDNSYYNSAIFLSPKGDDVIEIEPEYYHKSKLVVMAESNPFKKGPLKFMYKFVKNLAGGIGDFGTQPNREVFETANGCRIGTAICYESVFADFYREWALNGANLMSIITNDGWWRDTPGHKQHLNYARLRAIETRRSIARSANTGISALINQRGDIVQQTKWWERDYLSGSLNMNDKKTLFTIHGDIIGRLARFLAFLFILMGGARMISKKYITR